jgi:hypothetical protein
MKYFMFHDFISFHFILLPLIISAPALYLSISIRLLSAGGIGGHAQDVCAEKQMWLKAQDTSRAMTPW